MTREEHKAIIQQLMSTATADTQANLSTLLTQLSDDYESTLTERDQIKTTADKLTTDNETLRQANMKLFLKIGAEVPPTQQQQKPSNNGQMTEDKPLDFGALFNEKGDLL